jgi:acetolactate synthase-1/2/3 large subunit
VIDAVHGAVPLVVLLVAEDDGDGGRAGRALEALGSFTVRVRAPNDIPFAVRAAFESAESGRGGPSVLALPAPLLEEVVEGEPSPASHHPAPWASPDSVRRAAELIRGAERPLLVVGRDAVRTGVGDALTRLAERIPAPVAETYEAKGLVSEDHPLVLAAVGGSLTTIAETGADTADVVVAIGCDPDELGRPPWVGGLASVPLVHVGTRPTPMTPDYRPAIQVVGDLAASVDALASLLPPPETRNLDAVVAIHQNRVRRFRAYGEAGDSPVPPGRILHDVRLALGPDDRVVADSGIPRAWIADRYPALRPHTALLPDGVGRALYTAIALSAATPDAQVVALVGEDSLWAAFGELETARRLQSRITVVLWSPIAANDAPGPGDAGLFGHADGTETERAHVVEALGAVGWWTRWVDSARDFLPTLREALDAPPSLVAVTVAEGLPADA